MLDTSMIQPEKEKRRIIGTMKFRLLKALLAIIGEAAPESECKTIGNLHPDGLHCFACTFFDIRKRIERAIKFWGKGDLYKDALS